MVFTIITVCLNAEDEIGNTITSVLNQTCTDYEYLIKDGVSKDRTVSVAESFVSAFDEKGIHFRIISQSDSGIYDAMNQAVREARGEWIIFMNAGDWFAGSSVLDRVEKSGCLKEADVVYGDRILRNHELFRYRKAYALEDINFRMPFCHQSTFTRKELFGNNPYSLQYRVCSDHKFYLEMYQERKKFVYFPDAISIYDINGISSNWELTYSEKIQILESMPVRDEMAIQRIKQERDKIMKRKNREMFMHQHLWKFIPQKLRARRRAWIKKRKKNKNSDWKTEEEFFGEKKVSHEPNTENDT